LTPHHRYIIDSNVFIQAYRTYYQFDIAPGFWDSLIRLSGEGTILSIDRVEDEIKRNKDLLTDWIVTNFSLGFMSTQEDDVVEVYTRLMVWAQKQGQFSEAAVFEFSEVTNADAWVISYAIAKNCTLVTTEKFNPNIKKRIPIPNVCMNFSLEPIDTFEMLRRLRVRLRA